MPFPSLGLPGTAIDVPVVNVSTGAVTQYMVVVGGIRAPHTFSLAGGIDPTDGKYFAPAAPSTTAEASEVIGIAQETIPAGTTGLVRVFGASFVRVATNTLNAQSGATTTTVIGAVAGSTAVACFFYAGVTAAQTFTFGSKVYTFATAHAYGNVNALPFGRVR